MATTMSRQHGTYTSTQKKLPISKPTKSHRTYDHPVSKVALDPPELPDTSTVYSGRTGGTFSDISDEYDSRYPTDVNVMDQLSERMDKMWDPSRMDRTMAGQAKSSGEMNAKSQDLDDVSARLAARLRRSRVNFEDMTDRVAEARSDLKSSRKTLDSIKSRAARIDPDAYEDARRMRAARR